nr:unnamed protein product [Callosobruchus chinensis]
MQGTVGDLEEKLKHHQDEAVLELEEKLEHHQDEAAANVKQYFVEGIADLDTQLIVRLSSPRTLQDALVKALEIIAATKATRMTRRVRSVVEDDEIGVRATSFSPRRGGTFQRNPPVRTAPEGTEKFTCWRWGQKVHLMVGCRIQLDNMKNKESIDKLQQQHDAVMRKLNEKHDREAAVLEYVIRRLKEKLKTVTADRDRLKQLLDD